MAIPHYKVYKQEWIESERGWGQKHYGTTYHITLDEAKRFVREYNLKYNNEPTAPDWYVSTRGESPEEAFVPQDVYKKVEAEKSIWA